MRHQYLIDPIHLCHLCYSLGCKFLKEKKAAGAKLSQSEISATLLTKGHDFNKKLWHGASLVSYLMYYDQGCTMGQEWTNGHKRIRWQISPGKLTNSLKTFWFDIKSYKILMLCEIFSHDMIYFDMICWNITGGMVTNWSHDKWNVGGQIVPNNRPSFSPQRFSSQNLSLPPLFKNLFHN